MDKSPPLSSNSHLQEITRQFQNIGGEFVASPENIQQKLHDIRALVFDWDGVFNSGLKGADLTSGFSEMDSMGVNMLRFGFSLRDQVIPPTAVITGEKNPAALQFAQREHFHFVYLGIKDKRQAIEHLCSHQKLDPSQILCVFDDINDLGMAAMCGIRCMIHRSASPLFKQYVKKNALCDYITGNESGHYAVREICELLLGFINMLEKTIEARASRTEAYSHYFQQRQLLKTVSLQSQEGVIVPGVV